MSELNFFIRFLKDKNVYNLFIERVTEQHGINFLYKNLLIHSNFTESIIFSSLCWADTIEGSNYWCSLYNEYSTLKRKKWSVSSMDRM